MLRCQRNINYALTLAVGCSVNTAHAGIAELLLKKGVITPEEYQQLKTETAAQALLSTPAASTPVAPAAAPTPAVSFSKGFVVTGIDGTFQAQVGTLMQLDAAAYNDPEGYDNNAGTSMRRGRIYVQGSVMKDWQYRFESEFFGSSGTEITDAYVRYNGFMPFDTGKPLAVTAGHFKIPFDFEQLMSDKDLPFMERALPTAFMKTRAPGAMLSTSGSHWSASGMVFGEQLYSNTTAPQQDEGGGASMRFTWAPLVDDGAALHVGIDAQYLEPTQRVGGPTLTYSTRPESQNTSLQLISTGAIGGEIDDITLYAAEFAASINKVALTAEYFRSEVARKSADNLSFDGWYAQAAWALTGEIRPYDVERGIFKGLTPLRPVGTGSASSTAIGGWELALRYSELDLNDATITGGRERNGTLALSWYANNFVRISGNWVHVFDVERSGSVYDGESMDALQMRLQFAY